MFTNTRAILAVSILALLMTGCGGGGSTSSNTTASSSGSTGSSGGSSGGTSGGTQVFSFAGLGNYNPNITVNAVAIDGNGNAWVGFYGASYSGYGLVEILQGASPTCSSGCIQYNTGYNLAGIAVDKSNNIWGSIDHSTNLLEIFNTANTSCLSGCALYSLTTPYAFYNTGASGIAIDGNANVWLAGGGGGQTGAALEMSSGGVAIGSYSDSNLAAGGAVNGVAVDANNDVWEANALSNSVTEIKPTATQNCSSGCIDYTGGGLNGPVAIAADSLGDIWITDSGDNSVTEITTHATPTCSTGCVQFSGSEIKTPTAIAIDGADDVWIVNEAGNSVTELPVSNPNAPMSYTPGGMVYPTSIAIDGKGDVWIGTQKTVVEMIGAAMPVKTPLVNQPR